MFVCKDTKEEVENYTEYLKTKHWKKLKFKYISSRKKKYKNVKNVRVCECCGKKSTIQLHHKTYERIGNEKLTDLIQVCKKCHIEIHEVVKDRIKNGVEKNIALRTAHTVIMRSYLDNGKPKYTRMAKV